MSQNRVTYFNGSCAEDSPQDKLGWTIRCCRIRYLAGNLPGIYLAR